MISIDRLSGQKALDLSDRNLSKVHSAVSELTELEVLYFYGNNLKELTSIHKLRNLKWLSLYRDQLNELPEAVCELEQLEVLGVGFNNLRVLPNSFCKMRKLSWLNLSENKLSCHVRKS